MNEEQMRAAFEDWWKRTLLIKHELSIREIITYCERSPYGDYVHSGTALRWEGWKAALEQVLGKPAGEVIAATGSLNDSAVIKWTSEYRPKIGDKLYAPKEQS